ncbi:MAG: cyclic nucleotide-binding domain-containing protein [Gammaproteobacteria bacterium]|nr:cyclic nucleotide-binding domain-containing protein [Gammaproteobacteria bacterium]
MKQETEHPMLALLKETDFLEGEAWHRRHFPANVVIFEQGEVSRSLFLVVSGRIEASGSARMHDGKELKPSFTAFTAGDLFGELTLFDELPRSARVATVEDSEVIEFNGDALFEFMERHPEQGYRILYHITRSLVSRLRVTNEKLFSLYAWGLKAHGIDKHL